MMEVLPNLLLLLFASWVEQLVFDHLPHQSMHNFNGGFWAVRGRNLMFNTNLVKRHDTDLYVYGMRSYKAYTT